MEGKDLLIRCSSIGAIMTNSRSKSVPLSQTCKSHIIERFNEIEFGISTQFTNNYVKKGIDVEDESINLSTRVNNFDFVMKNEERFNNGFISGIPDALTDDFVLEVKSSWQLHTFPMMDDENKNKGYDWQVQGYLWLTEKERGYLCYCLIDTPEMIVQDEMLRVARKGGYIDLPEDVENEIRGNHMFGHIPEQVRCKTFEIRRDEEKIEQIKERIDLCREYYDELKTKLL